jgi:hypothetical protein
MDSLETIDTAAAAVRGVAPKRVFFAEWLNRPFAAGHGGVLPRDSGTWFASRTRFR